MPSERALYCVAVKFPKKSVTVMKKKVSFDNRIGSRPVFQRFTLKISMNSYKPLCLPLVPSDHSAVYGPVCCLARSIDHRITGGTEKNKSLRTKSPVHIASTSRYTSHRKTSSLFFLEKWVKLFNALFYLQQNCLL